MTKKIKLYDSKAVARFIDVTERRVRQLRDMEIISEYPGRPGLYDLTVTNHKYINYLRNKNPGSGNIDYNTERAKLVQAKRMSEEFDLKIKEGDLHSTADVESVMAGALTNFKTRLMAIPSKLAPMLCRKSDKSEIFRILKEHIDDALAELSDFDKNFEKKVGFDENSDE